MGACAAFGTRSAFDVHMFFSRARAEVGFALSDDHVQLIRLLDDALSSLCSDDPHATEAWKCFDDALRNHIEIEEHEAFPLFERAYPDEVAAFALEHTYLLALLDKLSPDQGVTRSHRQLLAAELSLLLRAHMACEEQLFREHSIAAPARCAV